MADKRISQLIERVDIANNDVLPIVASGATTTNKVTVSTLQDWMQSNLDVGVTSVGLSMPSAFVVSNSPVTGSGNISVTGAGTVSQYIRGDGSLADFPSGGGGGGSSVNYYLNGSVSQGTIGGIAYQEMNRTPILGAGTDFTIAADGYIASFITDAGDPALLEIPAGNWNFETYLQASSGGGTPSFYIELYKVDSGGTATLIASNSGSPELIAFGTTTTPYFSALAVPTTSLTLTDRLALRYYVTHSGRTITLHTENATLCQIITTFTTGLTALNGLTAQVQNFATGTSGTDFNISSSVSTHTFNLPNASATARGVISTGSQTFAGAKTFNSDIIVNGITVGKGIGVNNGNNTAIGLNCLSSNTTGTLNTATGLSALQYNTAGNSNTANGANSLLANTTGGFNTASGNQSLYSNTTGQANTAIGINSLYSNTTGTYNIGVGSGAGYYIADGSTPNTTSDFSIYLGADTKASVDNAQNEVVIGYNAIGSGSNTVTIGNSSVTDNYFTGTIRSTSLRLAAAGTADTTIFRNTSGTSSSTGSANVVGFNGSNNIFVTTNSKGGFLLDFNNSVSNRTYTLQDASGTLAFTSQIPTNPVGGTGAAGRVAYWNGAGTITSDSLFQWNDTFKRLGIGRTPTVSLDVEGAGYFSGALGVGGALNGTSATFSGDIRSNAIYRDYQGEALIQTSGSETQIGTSGASTPRSVKIFAGNSPSLTIASTGAATFSSSVQATAMSIGVPPTANILVVKGENATNDGTIQFGARGYLQHRDAGQTITSLANDYNSDAAKIEFRVKGNSTSDAKMTILGSGNVGIGTASPAANLDVQAARTANLTLLKLGTNNASTGNGDKVNIDFYSDGNNYLNSRISREIESFATYAGALTFSTGASNSVTERMRITSGGFTKARANGGNYFGGGYHEFVNNNNVSGDNCLAIGNVAGSNTNNTSSKHLIVADSAGDRLYIYGNGNVVNVNNSYGSLSDIKLKENIEDATPKLDDLMKVRIRNYNLIGEETKQIGVIAQELEEVFPAMIDDSEDFEYIEVAQLDEEGNEVLNEEGEVVTEKQRVSKGTTTKSVKYSVFVPMLIKAMQEQQEQIKELKTEIDSLKNQMQ